MLVKMELYGLNSSGPAFQSKLSGVLRDIGYFSTKGYPGVWILLTVKPDVTEYHDMVLYYVDNLLAILSTPMKTIEGIKSLFKLKGDKAEVTDMYQILETADGTEYWMIYAEKYVQAAVENVELKLTKSNYRYLPVATPIWPPPTIPVKT